MSLLPGARVGVYEVLDLVGRGGMGEVYRALDTSLRRYVAIKVLPAQVSADRESVARFEREALTLATLNHPNIAVVHGFVEVTSDGSDSSRGKALVMELVDGETLAERLTRGPLSLDEAFRIAGQIADALEAAHEKGIVHRDLKPANVKLTPSGLVKVLDFGLAKVVTDDGTPAASSTVTVATAPSTILGTPAYMAPEQAQGYPADRRADIWAFGVVLYEMVSGVRPFRGASTHETLAAVLTADPDWAQVPAAAEPLVQACLQRDLSKRLRHIGDYRFLTDRSRISASPRTKRSRAFATLLVSVALAGLGAGVAAGWRWFQSEPPGATVPVRLRTMLSADVNVTRGPGFASSVAVSPDGRTLIIAGTGREGRRLYVRGLERLDAVPLAGTERGWSPFFSWDGAWVGFYADGRLKRVPIAGGAAVDILAIPGFPSGASWGPDDQIVFSYGADSPLQIVSSAGGNAERIAGGPDSARHPEALPDGRTVLFESGGWVHAIDRATSRSVRLVQGTAPRFADGHLIFVRGTDLLGARFDASRLELTGPVVPLVEGIAVELPGSAGGRHYSLSRNGTLAFVPAADRYALVLVGNDGNERVITNEQKTFENPRFSPRDGRLVVVATTERDGQPADLWMHDLQAGTETRLTFDGGRSPVWTPDGTGITYSHLGEPRGIYVKRADGTGDATQFVPLPAFHWLIGWTPDRRTLAYGLMNKSVSSVVSHTGGQSHEVVGPGNNWGGRLSPDGRWLAYYVLNSGNFEVFVTPFPAGGTRHLIAEGTDPAWSPNGGEIYYRSGSQLMAARVDKSAGVRVLSRRVVVDSFLPPLYDDYDVHPDGRTLILVRPANRTQGREVTVVVDWFDELRRLLATP